jgi:hypothetical protein
MKKSTVVNIIHWTASIIGTLMVAFTLFIGIGELFEGKNKPGPGLDTYTIITFIVWGIGLGGLIYAIWKPRTGGLLSLVSFIVFNILVVFHPNSEATYTPVLLLFLIPSVLFLLVWSLKNQMSRIENP